MREAARCCVVATGKCGFGFRAEAPVKDDTAVTERYDLQDPIVVADELAEAASAFADQYDHVSAQQWSRSGLRSDGFSFTVESFGRYFLHDPAHHIVDVRRGFEILEAR